MAKRVPKTRASKRAAVPAHASAPDSPRAVESGLSAHIDGFLDSMRVGRAASDHTIRAYRTDLEAFERWCVRKNVDPLKATYRELRGYLGEMDAARYSRTTINRRLSSLRGFYAWMNEEGVIDDDPVSLISGPKQGKHLPHVLKREDMERLLCVHGPRDREGNEREQTPSDMRDQAFLELLYACGMRISEAAGLTIGDIDFRSRLVKVYGKGRKERIVPLHDLCIRAMLTYLNDARPVLLGGKRSDRVFISTRGNPMSADALRKVFKASVRAAGLDETLSPHDMRHTFATDLLAGEADLRSVQEMLGHSRLSTTQVYTHLSPTRLKEAHMQSHPRASSSR